MSFLIFLFLSLTLRWWCFLFERILVSWLLQVDEINNNKHTNKHTHKYIHVQCTVPIHVHMYSTNTLVHTQTHSVLVSYVIWIMLWNQFQWTWWWNRDCTNNCQISYNTLVVFTCFIIIHIHNTWTSILFLYKRFCKDWHWFDWQLSSNNCMWTILMHM